MDYQHGLIDRQKMPPQVWQMLTDHFASAPNDAALAIRDRLFDSPAMYVGNSAAVKSYQPFLLKITTVSERSLRISLKLAINTRLKGHRAFGEETWGFISAANAMNCNLMQTLLEKSLVEPNLVTTYLGQAENNIDDIMYSSVKAFLESPSDIQPDDVVEWAKDLVWVQNILSDTQARLQNSRGGRDAPSWPPPSRACSETE